MAENSNISLLDPGQVIRRVYDKNNDSIRIMLADAVGIAIELSADDGDSVTNRPEGLTGTVALTNANTGVVVAEQACVGMKQFNLHSKTTSATVGPQALTVEWSPSDTADIWIASGITLTPSAVSGTVVSATEASLLARRVRVRTAAAITSGTIDVYLIARAV